MGDKQFTIEQRGTAQFAGSSFSYTSLREIVVNPQTTIESTQIEFEVPLGPAAVLRLHRACYQIWQEECEALPSR